MLGATLLLIEFTIMVRSMPSKKRYSVGLYIGRFQPFHIGHWYVVQEALKECEKLVVAIGSAQEARTEKNPFNFYERMSFIAASLNWEDLERIIIIGVNDRENKEDNSSWGEYLINEVLRLTDLQPGICFTGEEQVRQHWFDTVEIDEKVISRDDIPVSATMVREAVRTNNKELFLSMVPIGMENQWDKMREVLCNE